MCDSVPASLPPDYYERIFAVEERHWWHRGMRDISAALLGGRLVARARVLDAGCGTGGFLRWLVDRADVTAAGIDVSPEAIERARVRVPDADLHVAPVAELPFEEDAFDLVTLNDVLQHIPEEEMERSLEQLRRVLRPGGTLLIRTGGARRARQERSDWRIYDRRALRSTLEAAGFSCKRVTYVNVLGSLLAAARGHSPHAPTEHTHGIPAQGNPAVGAGALLALRAEAALLTATPLGLPYGHTLFALAVPRGR